MSPHPPGCQKIPSQSCSAKHSSPENFAKVLRNLYSPDHSRRDPPTISPPWTCWPSIPAYLEGSISVALEPSLSTGHLCPGQCRGISLPGVRTPSAQPTAMPIRGPASSAFLEPIKFFYPTLPILWESFPNSSSVPSLLGAASANPWSPIFSQTIPLWSPRGAQVLGALI